MNKILLIIALILLPFCFIVNQEEEKLASSIVLDNKKEYILEIPGDTESEYTVMLSNNKDKSNAFTMPLEEYVIGVVAAEMPASFDMEALKAQAVASRTFAYYKTYNTDYVLSTTINDQAYITEEEMQNKWKEDYDYYYARVKQAVEETEGEIVTYDGSVAITYYFAISNGYTDDAKNVFNEDRDYLVSVDSSWDKNYAAFKSVRTMSVEDFKNEFNITDSNILINNVVRGENNYVNKIDINGKTYTGLEVFNILSLKSRDFEIEVEGNNVYITTYGFGHGVGMSQYGALGMASQGYNYKDILTYYYQDTEIAKI